MIVIKMVRFPEHYLHEYKGHYEGHLESFAH